MTNYSIIQKSQLEGANRIDAEYYQPEYLEAEEKISTLKNKPFGEVLETLTDYHANGSYEVLKNYGKIQTEPDHALMVRAVDLQSSNFDNDVRYVSEGSYNFLKKTKIYGGELIINKIGNAGMVYFMPKLNRPVTLGMNLFMLRLKNNFDSRFVYVFLNSKYGKLSIYRRVTGTNPSSIDKDSVRSIKIPVFSIEAQNIIGQLVDKSFEEEENSKTFYQQAGNLLLEELGLKDFKIPEYLSFIVNYSDTEKVDRVDADYFQPKYDDLISKIKIHNLKSIEMISSLVGHSAQPPYSENGNIAVLAQKHMKQNLLIDDSNFDNFTTETLIKSGDKKFILEDGDILISSVGEPGLTCVWTKDNLKTAIPGSFVTVVRPEKDINPLYLGVLLNTIVGKLQFDRDYSGSIQQYVYSEKIKEILIPILPTKIQQKIADLVKKSHGARKKSKELLEEAKRRVEEMIENSAE